MEEKYRRLRRFGVIGKRRGATTPHIVSSTIILWALAVAFFAEGHWLVGLVAAALPIPFLLLLRLEYRAYPKEPVD